jgi:hypothetical protein
MAGLNQLQESRGSEVRPELARLPTAPDVLPTGGGDQKLQQPLKCDQTMRCGVAVVRGSQGLRAEWLGGLVQCLLLCSQHQSYGPGSSEHSRPSLRVVGQHEGGQRP